MGYVIGETEGLSTWGKCRRAVGQAYIDPETNEFVDNERPDVNEMHNTLYISPVIPRFKSSKGSGLLKGIFVEGIPPNPFVAYFPYFGFNRTYYISGVGYRDFVVGAFTVQDEQELLGESVTVSGGIFEITEAAIWPGIPPGVYQRVPEHINGPVFEVGKLTTF